MERVIIIMDVLNDSDTDDEYDSDTDDEYDSDTDDEYDSDYDSDTDDEYDSDYDSDTDNRIRPIYLGTKKLRFNYGVDLPNFDVSLLYNLESINILGRCFQSVKVFKIDGLNRLKRLVIGVESFTNGTDKEMDKSKSFHVLNCKSLKLIKMGRYAFHDYAGEFELKNLPSLVSLNIGESAEIDCGAYNFYHCSFVVRGFEILKDF